MPVKSAGGVSTMAWFYLESLTALFILLGIVWWTMAPSRKPRPGASRESDAPGDPESPRNANRGLDRESGGGPNGGRRGGPDRGPH
ncbi:MAG: hypothetical protein WCB48_07470 [Casimicrobiaceae bacterium]